jgi:hypothetical protein
VNASGASFRPGFPRSLTFEPTLYRPQVEACRSAA